MDAKELNCLHTVKHFFFFFRLFLSFTLKCLTVCHQVIPRILMAIRHTGIHNIWGVG
jgi:hypothetical protein